ncbi:MAG TPA: alpha-2-macroglobulin family protein, partial [Myxococcota bacterium]|nr:alpha-2-macroglobulin family protein [Myxococcota bacterium]
NLGTASLQLEAEAPGLDNRTHLHSFSVQEFRRPEFEVKAAASEGPHLAGGSATVTVAASYYAGGALPGAEVSWNVVARAGSFRPPNREGFVFGSFVPWWRPLEAGRESEQRQAFAARTDAAGRHRLRIDFERQPDEPRPRLFTAEATVMDVNRQAWTAQASLLVHAADRYVGLRSERTFVQKGEPIALDAIATDLDGRAAVGSLVRLTAERLEWEQLRGEWQEVAHDREERTLRAEAEPVRVTIGAKEGGVYRILARVADAQGRDNQAELRVWVAGGRVPPRRELEQEDVTLVPDRRTYQPGEVAKLLVIPPFAPAEGVLTLRRSGLVREQRFTIAAASETLAIPIEDGFTPNVQVQVDLVGAAPREAAAGSRPTPARPAFASGRLSLDVPPRSRSLALAVTPREPALAPGGETVLDLSLQDATGAPAANGEAAVVVVDEAVLALTGYRLPDPLAVFYSWRTPDVADYRLRSHVLLATPDILALLPNVQAEGAADVAFSAQAPLPASAPMRRMAAREKAEDEQAAAPIRARTDFRATALFAASVPLDAAGRASVPVKLPDSLTRYRVMAVAVSGARRFGSAEATLVARLPLMVRPSPPRFLNFGDRFELPVVVQNQTDREMSVDVAVRAGNAALTDGAGRRLVVAANDRAEVRFPMAAERAGSARIQVGAVSGPWADAAELELPVWTPATTEAFATYGELDAGSVAQPVRAPEGARPELGGLELTTSSTALQALTDAVLYLVAYPFECAEQLSSRVLAVAALRDVLGAFQAEGLPKPDDLEQAVKRDVDRLRALQNDDGGFGFWRRGDRSWPYVSIHVAHAL